MKSKKYTFIDLFAGIGGFHIAMESIGVQCVFASEWDKFARLTYEANFAAISPSIFQNGKFAGDINKVDKKDIPDFDILCAGFPCQPFSNAGLRKGFEDTRGTLFFNIVDILNTKIEKGSPPKVVLLENVKGLKNHNKGKTLHTILATLNDLGYKYTFDVLNAKNFGTPQNRERLFIVAWNTEIAEFNFPFGIDNNGKIIYNKEFVDENRKSVKLGDILLKEVSDKYTISDKLHQGHLRRKSEHERKGNGFGFSVFNSESEYTNTISARYYKDGSEIMINQDGRNPRKLHPVEAGRLQGYPIGNGFNIVVSDVQAYKQFGNSVAIPVVKALAQAIKEQILKTK